MGNGSIINIEVQKGEQNDDVKRCRFHLSSITANKTPKGTDYSKIPDVTIVYITEYDALGNGKTVTCSQMCQKLDDEYIPYNDGAKIYYVNTVCKDDTDKSELLQLFLEKDSFYNEKFSNLSKAIQYFKEDERGVRDVCTIVEEYAKEYVKEYAKEFALYLIKDGKSDIEIVSITHLTPEEVENLREN